MKTRFTAFDIQSILFECREKLVGLRALNIYDVDKKTYLIRFVRQDEKYVLLLESGIRLHITDFDWPKNMMPSGFTMKLRKHLRQKRLESIDMMGMDRIINMQFGTDEMAHHIILELYDRGNIILTDYQGRILSLLRPRAINEQTKFAVNEIYPFHLIKIKQELPSPAESARKVRDYIQTLATKTTKDHKVAADDNKPENASGPVKEAPTAATGGKRNKGTAGIIASSAVSLPLKKVLASALSSLPYGPSLLEHCLLTLGLDPDRKLTLATPCTRADAVAASEALVGEGELEAVMLAVRELFISAGGKINEGYIYYKRSKEGDGGDDPDGSTALLLYQDFEPMAYAQASTVAGNENRLDFASFAKCVDDFFSKMESQKLDLKAEGQERTAIKKLENVRQDHVNRRIALQKSQEDSSELAELIELNRDLVDEAIKIIQSGLAAQMNWSDLRVSVEEAKKCGDTVALAIKSLKLDTNRMIMQLRNPFVEDLDERDQEETLSTGKDPKKKGKKDQARGRVREVEIDLNLSAYNNARSYYERKRHAFTKELKTLESSGKALKSAERKTKQLLKDFQTAVSISKSRKIYWFEKFYWFISSENYLVLAGRDQQQNELLVKRYLSQGDLYVHADIHGGSSIIVKNPTGTPVTPKTLSEAGVMAACYSSAWEAKVTVGVWWVHNDQVSKTAPTGEYLTTGSFMIRGKKNFLPPLTLIMGFGIMFKLDDASADNHRKVRKLKVREGDDLSEGIGSGQDLQSEQGEVELHMSENGEDSSGGEESSQVVNDDNDATIDGQSYPSFPDTAISGPVGSGGGAGDDSKGFEGGRPDDPEDAEYTPILAPSLTTSSRQKILNKRKKAGKATPATLAVAVEDKPSLVDKLGEGTGNLKRGQKAKLKKIKEKYGDQDEEERKLKLELLAANYQTNQMSKASKKATKSKLVTKGRGGDPDNPKSASDHPSSLFDQFRPNQIPGPRNKLTSGAAEPTDQDTGGPGEKNGTLPDTCLDPDTVASDGKAEDVDEEEGEGEEDQDTSGNFLLDTLTGRPVYDDNPDENSDSILFALPVCAPYTALQDYKYRVKVIPGFTKRGKAGKSALSYFLALASKPPSRPTNAPKPAEGQPGPKTNDGGPTQTDRNSVHPLTTIITSKNASTNPSLVERALIKAIKDNDLSRNIPSRVKIYVPVASKNK